MLNFRRALVATVFIITVLYLTIRLSTPTAAANAPVVAKSNVQSVTAQQVMLSTSSADKKEEDWAGIDSLRTDNKNTNNGPLVYEQTVLQDKSDIALYDKLALQFPYDAESKFPAYLWQTWRYTPAENEFNFRDEEASWTKLHPGFIHEVVSDGVAEHMVRLFYASLPEVLEAYDLMPLPVLKADFFRYLILLARGGIYSDIDTISLKSAIDWLPDSVPRDAVGLVVGIEADPDRADWVNWYSRRIQFCQWTIQSKPGHPVLRGIVQKITEKTLNMSRSGVLRHVSQNDVVEYTGPAVWTDMIFEYFNDKRFFDMSKSPGKIDWQNLTGMSVPKRVGDVIVLPITSFSPGVMHMGSRDYSDPMAFVRHIFEGSWKPSSKQKVTPTA